MTALREKMTKEMELRDFAPNTMEAYLSAVKGLAVTLQYRRQFSLQIPWHGSPPMIDFDRSVPYAPLYLNGTEHQFGGKMTG